MSSMDRDHQDPSGAHAAVNALVSKLRSTVNDDPEPIKAELIALAAGPAGSDVRDHISSIMSGELLPVQWELEEVLEASAPAAPEPEQSEATDASDSDAEEEEAETPEPEDPNRPLTSADLNLVYDDPRGLMLHKTKTGDRWFATQVDPRTGQPQTFELHQQEISQLQQQLQGSPYWVIGA